MKENKTCCRIYPIILILISTVFALAIWYLDERFYSFSFLTDKNEIFNFIGSLLFISILPIGLFYFLSETSIANNYQSRELLYSELHRIPLKIRVTMR